MRKPSFAFSAQTNFIPFTSSTFLSLTAVFRTEKAAWTARPRSLSVRAKRDRYMGRILVMGRTPQNVPLSMFSFGTNRRLAIRTLPLLYA